MDIVDAVATVVVVAAVAADAAVAVDSTFLATKKNLSVTWRAFSRFFLSLRFGFSLVVVAAYAAIDITLPCFVLCNVLRTTTT